MDTAPLTDEDETLIGTIGETNERTFDAEFFDGGHIVTAGIRTADGEIYEGVSLPTAIGRASVCGEPVAIGAAIADGYGHDEIETCVAVSHPMPSHDASEITVVPPCGVCREMLADYNEGMRVVVPVEDQLRVVRAIDLLPARTW